MIRKRCANLKPPHSSSIRLATRHWTYGEGQQSVEKGPITPA